LINIIAKDVFELKTTPQYANDVYNDKIDSIESMICLHYFAGSSFKNEFWDYAESLGVRKIEHKMSSSNVFSNMIKKALFSNNIFDVNGDVGTWSLKSYKINIEKLGIKDRLQQYI
jgi:hypothetical protein